MEEFLVPLNVSLDGFATRIGVSAAQLESIVSEQSAVTPSIALRLSRVLGMSVYFWLGLQQDWDVWQTLHGEQAEDIALLEPLLST